MNIFLKQKYEYKWINNELSKIIFNKNQFTEEIISYRINLAQTTIIDIDKNLKKLKISKIKKISYSILKILTFCKIDKNKIIKTEMNLLNKVKEELSKKIKTITTELYIKKTNINVKEINNNQSNLALKSTKTNTAQLP